MATQSKIDRMGFGDRVWSLAGEGKTTAEIAGILTEHCDRNGLGESFDQSTVSRYLKKLRDEERKREERLNAAAEVAIKTAVEKGLDRDFSDLEKVQDFFMNIVEDALRKKGSREKVTVSLKERMEAGRSIVRLIGEKLKFPGVLDGNYPGSEKGGSKGSIPSGSNVYSLLERLEKTVGAGTEVRSEEGGSQ